MRGNLWIVLALVTIGLVWVCLVKGLLSPPAEDLYDNWLRNPRGTPQRLLDRIADFTGSLWLRKASHQAHIRLTERLLKHPDYAFAVAEGSKRDPGLNGRFDTWPHLIAALEHWTGASDPEGLKRSLDRVNSDMGANWEMTLLKSAQDAGARKEIDQVIEQIRSHETRLDLGSTVSESLQQFARLFDQSPADLGRLVVDREMAPHTAALARSVLDDRGIRSPQEYGDLLSSLKANGLAESDYDLVRRFASDKAAAEWRVDLLVWLLASSPCESYRNAKFSDLTAILDQTIATEPPIARLVLNRTVQSLSKDVSSLPSDWRRVTEHIVDRVGSVENLSHLLDDEAGRDFVWMCYRLRDTATLVRAVRQWSKRLENPSLWIGEFIEGGEQLAACTLIEEQPEESMICESTDLAVKRQPLSFYANLWDQLPPLASTPQSGAYINMLVALRGATKLPPKDRMVALEELMEAIQTLAVVEPVNPRILGATVSHLVKLDPALFEAGRPCFDRWRQEVTFDQVAQEIFRGSLDLDTVNEAIWKDYANQVFPSSEMPNLLSLIERIIDGDSRLLQSEDVSRLEDFLGADSWGYTQGETRGMHLVDWVAKKMILAGEMRLSVEWISTQVSNYRTRFPDEDASLMIDRLCNELYPSFDRVPLGRSLEWLGYALDGDIAKEVAWPRSLNRVLLGIGKTEPEPMSEIANRIEKAFRENVHRDWILHEVMIGVRTSLNGSTETSSERFSKMRKHVSEKWLADAIDAMLREPEVLSIDVDSFEKALESEPRAAQYYPLRAIVDRSWRSIRHSSGRNLTDDEYLRFVVGMANFFLETANSGSQCGNASLDKVFGRLAKIAKAHPGDPRIVAISRRLQAVDLNTRKPGVSPLESETLIRWRDRFATSLEEKVVVEGANEASPVDKTSKPVRTALPYAPPAASSPPR